MKTINSKSFYLWHLILILTLTFSILKVATLFAQEKTENNKEETIYTCPMHPEIQQNQPGECPKCHMDLEPIKNKKENSKSSEPSKNAIIYTCPMHPEIQQNQPGICPKCKMFLEAEKKHGDVHYTCPMHPEIKQEQPGKCPKCKMFLEAVKGDAKDLTTPTHHHENHSMHLVDTPMTPTRKSSKNKKQTIYTCSMHPQIRTPNPGSCPICNMPLVPIEEDDDADDESSANQVRIAKRAQRIMGLELYEVEEENIPLSIEVFGKIDYNQTTKTIQTARSNGLIQKVYFTTEGQMIKKGNTLYQIRSDEIDVAIKEYLLLKEMNNQKELIELNESKLLRFGLTKEQINNLKQNNNAIAGFDVMAESSGVLLKKHINVGSTINIGDPLFEIADLDTVWAYLDLYEETLPSIQINQKVKITAKSLPNKEYEGTITQIPSEIDPELRILRIPVVINNQGYYLKKGTFIKAKIYFEEKETKNIFIPKTAILDSGKRKIIYKKVANNTFEALEVNTGIVVHNKIQIISGLKKGDKIVAQSGFLIDSQAQIEGKPSLYNQEGLKVSEKSMGSDHD